MIRRLVMVLSVSAVLLAVPVPRFAADAPQVRDAIMPGRAEPKGAGEIRGTIVSDDTPPRPLRRAVVTISEAVSTIAARTVTSDETGRFAFRALPSGRYSISASRAPYLPGAYGATRVAGPGSLQTGTAIALEDGQQIEGLAITLVRGAVITGTLRDPDGQPARGFPISPAYYRRDGNGRRALVRGREVTTDDRGVFRMFGLSPGAYFLMVSVSQPDGTLVTEEDIRRALSQQDRTSSPTSASRRTVGYAPVFFPGTPDLAQAMQVTVAAAEERSGVDFQVQFVPMARIAGVLTGQDGKPTQGVRVTAMSDEPVGSARAIELQGTTTDQFGRFTIHSIPPGAYSVDANAERQPGSLWASAEVIVSGEDQTVDLTLRPTLTIKGRVTFDANALTPPNDLTKTRVTLAPAGRPMPGPMGAALDKSGTFTVPGVVPGRYQLNALLPIPSLESGWYLASATINGQETLEGPVDIRPTDSDIESVIRFTDRPTEIAGTITDTQGQPAPEYFLIVFAADESQWRPFSRRIMQVRPSHDGAYVFRNLPPGQYRVAAVTQVEQGQWFDPAFLRQLVPASAPVTLIEHGKVRQDLRVAR